MMEAWKVFCIETCWHMCRLLADGRAIFQNPFLPSRQLCSANLSLRLIAAGCVKLGHILSISLETLGERTGIKSIRLLKQVTDELLGELNFDQRLFINNSNYIKEWMIG